MSRPLRWLLLALPIAARAQQPEALWYATDREESVQSFLAHADQISIVSPQVFAMNSMGVIRGHVDPRVVAKAREMNVKLVPLVMNPGFDQSIIHRVLTVPAARKAAVKNMAALCKAERFDGLQFDFENIAASDKDAFTRFARESADALHAVGCTLSAAVVPRTGAFPGPTAYHRWIFDNWRGVYDYTALAESLDFLSFMTYAQHTGNTTPGPVAGFPWMERALEYLLSLGVPPEKISIGIPSYSDWWYTGYSTRSGPRPTGRDISYKRGAELLAQYKAEPVWDDRQKTLYATWENDGLFEHLFLEDARSFLAKMELVSKYRLRGYSVWVLGTEDPKVWEALGPGSR
jgi:spore germination protein YaaH